MNDLFVTHEIAKELNKLGFDKNCIGYFKYSVHTNHYELKFSNYSINKWYSSNEVAAPLWQQVIDWFEEKFNYNIKYNTHKKTMEYNVLMAIRYQKMLIENKECQTELNAQ